MLASWICCCFCLIFLFLLCLRLSVPIPLCVCFDGKFLLFLWCLSSSYHGYNVKYEIFVSSWIMNFWWRSCADTSWKLIGKWRIIKQSWQSKLLINNLASFRGARAGTFRFPRDAGSPSNQFREREFMPSNWKCDKLSTHKVLSEIFYILITGCRRNEAKHET